MKELLFVTTNKGKVASLQRYMDDGGLSITVKACPLELDEIQADTALEVARHKAAQAFAKVGKPLVVDDSEFRIISLNGFPGPYQKYMVHTLGPEGVVRLMAGYTDRRAYFVSNLVFVDSDESTYEFSDDPFNVTIVETYDDSVPEYDWGALGKICIMEGTDKVLSLVTPEERSVLDKTRESADAYEKFSRWYKEHHA